jgi:hypothetical protein
MYQVNGVLVSRPIGRHRVHVTMIVTTKRHQVFNTQVLKLNERILGLFSRET